MESTNILAEFSSQPIASCLNSGKRTSSCEPSTLAGKTALGEEDSRQDTFPRVHRGGEAAPEKEGTPQPDEELDIKEKEEVVKRIFRSNSFSCDPHLPVSFAIADAFYFILEVEFNLHPEGRIYPESLRQIFTFGPEFSEKI